MLPVSGKRKRRPRREWRRQKRRLRMRALRLTPRVRAQQRSSTTGRYSNDTNLAEAIRQKDAAQWKAALQEKAYKEVYATASEGIFAAAHIASAAADGAKLLCKAGDEANKLLVSDYNADHNLLDLDAAFAFTDVRTQYKSIALTASNTTPIAHCFQQLRKIDKRARQHK